MDRVFLDGEAYKRKERERYEGSEAGWVVGEIIEFRTPRRIHLNKMALNERNSAKEGGGELGLAGFTVSFI